MSKLHDLLDQEAEAAETAEADAQISESDPLPDGTSVTRGHGRSRTLQIRLNGDEYHELELLAKGRELPISTVARGLLLSALAPAESVTDAIKRAELALDQARRLLSE
jgi:hypothetical protein